MNNQNLLMPNLDRRCLKYILNRTRVTLANIANKDLSDTDRLTLPAITIKAMTPNEYKNGGENLSINYSFSATQFGKILIASTATGICSLEFYDNDTDALHSLQQRFHHARLNLKSDSIHQKALTAFSNRRSQACSIKLHLKGSEFQLKVWNALLKIPFGGLLTYSDVASAIDRPQACRAVGSAIGKNPVAFIIPCHRIIRSTGEIGSYRWGKTRKTTIISLEATSPESLPSSEQSDSTAI